MAESAPTTGAPEGVVLTTATSDSAPSNAVPLSAAPLEDQLVEHEGQVYRTIREGKAFILVPPNARTVQDPTLKRKGGEKEGDESEAQHAQNVFYNPIQQFNRDLSVLAIRAFGRDSCERKRVKFEGGREKGEKKRERRREGKEKSRAATEIGVEQGSKRIREADGEEDNTAPAKVRKVGDGKNALLEDESGSAEKMQMDETKTNGEGGAETSTTNNHTATAQEWKPRFRILDALSATGLRALRYAQEIPFATSITANDMSSKAVKSIGHHVEHNRLTDKITATTGNAIGHMYSVAHPPTHTHGPDHISGKYDVIDLDPYGTAAPFIDAAVQALNDGGMLCVTCTDSGVFASCGYAEKTFSLYGGMPVKGAHSHEAGLRLIMHSVATSAARYGIAVEPLLSLSIDYYVRLFIRVRKSPADVKFLAGKTMVVYGCDSGCGAWTTQTLGRSQRVQGKGPNINWKYGIAQAPSADKHCEHCGSKTHVAGPMWGGPLHNPAFIERILQDVQTVDKSVYHTTTRIEGMLNTALEELYVADFPEDAASTSDSLIPKIAPELLDRQSFFFIPSALAKVLHCQAPPEAAIKGALRHAGYHATRSHCKPGSVKTTAPWPAIWEVMREWVKQKSPIKEGALREGSAGWRIMRTGVESAAGEEVSKDETGTNGDSTAAPAEAVTKKKNKIIFDEALGRDKPGKKMVRYQQNPRENWGPMARAK